MGHLIREESPQELFKELVEEALAHQNVDTTEASAFYLVHLLDAFIRPDRLFANAELEPGQALAEIYCQAVTSEGMQRFARLKLAADLALFLSGFLAESLNRQLCGADYYVRLGGAAYGSVAVLCHHRPSATLFDEMSKKFLAFADVLSEVSETCALADTNNLLRLYSRWQETGSPRSAAVLRKHGILVVPGSQATN